MSDDDGDLKRAIALSLMEAQTSSLGNGAGGTAGYTSDDEEQQFQRDLQRAIEASNVESEEHRAVVPMPQTPATYTRGAPTSSGSTTFLSERAQLEKERLARLKRYRDESDDHENSGGQSEQPFVKRSHISSIEPTDRKVNQHQSSSFISSNSSSSSMHEKVASEATGGPTVPVIDQLFWDGELRPTANRHSQPREDGKATFRLSEVLGPKADISFAIISSYSTSTSWIYEFFDPRTPVILVTQPDPSGRAAIKNVLPNWIMTVPFLRYGRGCQHMKIFYKTGRLRVVISTANLIDYDWRDIENLVWLQDVPPRSKPIPCERNVVDDFPSIMQKILHAINVHPALANMLANDHLKLPIHTIEDLRSKWDFSKVRVKLIPSIAGKHEGWPAVIQTGHIRLMKAVRDLGLRTGKGKAAKELVLECQGSSIGSYSTQWLNEFHWSARGESAEEWLDEPKTRRSKIPWPPVKIVFPSLKTVRATVLGEPGGGTTFCRTNQWEATKFPKELFHDSNSAGGRVLMHTKMIIATLRRPSPFASSSKSGFKANSTCPTSSNKGKSKIIVISDSETESESDVLENASEVQKEPIGWAYIGSHNFTPSAWGTLSGSGFNPTLNVVNYELGIVFPLYEEKDVKRVSCFKRPPRKYVLGEDRPWIQDDSPVFKS
ncbi:tyrosyl-DNA phosphodiesterase-domain-containing protein [Butyriboletus roseoflavus]|nr:tyrosyl-DNA phosphodiesterase-domain-containing protein [Butyriboletus roseoflavus]